MARKKRMATLWEVPDDLWERISQLLDEYDPPKATGRKREDARKILDGLIFRFRTGCQWNHIPSLYGDDSTLHRTFQRWEQIGLFEKIWSLLIEECDELGQVDWQWQSAEPHWERRVGAATRWVRTQQIGPKAAQNEVFSLKQREGR
jgi:putative transposase